jgi:hyperosmotically inducible periplasmic protein
MNTLAKKSNLHSVWFPTAVVTALAVILGSGLSACDNNDQFSENRTQMHEQMDHAQGANSDIWITAKMKSELLGDNLSKGLDIQVTTVDGVVSLDGKVKNSETMLHVQKLASGIKGVVEVDTTGLITE